MRAMSGRGAQWFAHCLMWISLGGCMRVARRPWLKAWDESDVAGVVGNVLSELGLARRVRYFAVAIIRK